jgi:ribosomal protein L17
MLLWACFASGQDVASIIQRSSEANDRDWDAVPNFDNSERDRKKDGDKTYEVTMLYGSPYERLIAMNESTLTAARQKEEQEKYEKAIDERKHESADKRSERIAKYKAERNRDHTLIHQMTTAFDFRLIGRRKFGGYKVYVLRARPRRGYKPPDRDSEVLTGMEGTLWIDEETFQWVKVEAHVIHPVRIEGFLAEVEPGTNFEVEKRPVAGNIWMASHYSMKANAKIMLLFPHTEQEDDTFFNYHRSSPNSSNR